jgi:hypothetical protein
MIPFASWKIMGQTGTTRDTNCREEEHDRMREEVVDLKITATNSAGAWGGVSYRMLTGDVYYRTD